MGEQIYLSGDGSHVAFTSEDANIVAGDTNGTSDVFVRDVAAARTDAITVDASGAFGDAPSYASGISNDGRVVLVLSNASTFVDGDDVGSADGSPYCGTSISDGGAVVAFWSGGDQPGRRTGRNVPSPSRC